MNTYLVAILLMFGYVALLCAVGFLLGRPARSGRRLRLAQRRELWAAQALLHDTDDLVAVLKSTPRRAS